jgi:hypothetical protein
MRVRALYDFTPEIAGELALKEGDILDVTKQEGEWYEGINIQSQARGWFPVNYVEKLQS